MKNLNNQSGRSMIEMLGVLAIIGVLSVGGIAGYSKAMMKFKINKALDQVAMTVTNIRTMYAQQNDYNGLSDSLAISLGLVDDAMVSGTALNSPFGTFALDTSDAGTMNGNSSTGFTITLSGIPKEACVAIATNSWGSAFSAGFLGIGVNTSAGDCTISSGTISGGLACAHGAAGRSGALIAVSDAADACSQAVANSIMLKYY